MVHIILAVVLGFAFDGDPLNLNDQSVKNNPVLFNRVDMFKDWLIARNFTPEERSNLRVVLSGRKTVLKDGYISSDFAKLSSESTEAAVMAKYIEQLSDTHPVLKDLTVVQENFSTSVFENAIFTFWTLKQMIKEQFTTPEELETLKEVEINVFTSDFKLVEANIVFRLVYESLKKIDEIIAKVNIPVIAGTFQNFSDYSEDVVFRKRIIHSSRKEFEGSSGKKFDANTLTDLKEQHKDDLIGFFGHLENKNDQKWSNILPILFKQQIDTTLDEVINKEQNFISTRGITGEDVNKGIIDFCKVFLTKIQKRRVPPKIIII